MASTAVWPCVALFGADAMQVSGLAAALQPKLAEAGIFSPLDISGLLPSSRPSASSKADSSVDRVILLLALGPSASDLQRTDQARLRQALSASGGYQVIHGQGAEALEQVLAAVQAADPNKPQTPPQERRPWTWNCEKCSDSACEHRWLTDLLASREAQG